VLSANGYYYKVTSQKTIIVIPDQPAKHQQYDELVMKTFFISHADATELAQIVNSVMRIPQMAVQPMVMPFKTSNTIIVRGTAPVVEIMERLIKANDKPRAEVLLDVEILEVDRARTKRYGINLSSYQLNLLFSPELAPPNTSGISAPPPFNLNTISQGINTADFYLGVPTAVVNFLESDNKTKILAKPQLRGPGRAEADAEPRRRHSRCVQTVFGAPGGRRLRARFPSRRSTTARPASTSTSRRAVTYEGEIVLGHLGREQRRRPERRTSAASRAPSFTSRKVHTFLPAARGGIRTCSPGLDPERRRQQPDRADRLMRPAGVQADLLGATTEQDTDTDIVMLITPHIIATTISSKETSASIYIGTAGQSSVSPGPPQLIAPQPPKRHRRPGRSGSAADLASTPVPAGGP
jgi:general secretion pathway protein D